MTSSIPSLLRSASATAFGPVICGGGAGSSATSRNVPLTCCASTLSALGVIVPPNSTATMSGRLSPVTSPIATS